MGFYGSRGDEPVTEATETGTGFLAEVCRAWEAACAPAESAGVRVVRARVGVVLGPSGGALKKMLPIFKLGMGGPMGSGRQYIPWIALTDVVRGLRWLIENSQVEGPVNFTGPEPVTQKVFAQTLGRVLRRPAFMPTPAFALRCMLGREMANEMLLGGANISPKVLIEDGFSFQCPNLEKALRLELDRTT